MKRLLAFVLLAGATPATACLPPLGDEPPRSHYVRQTAAGARDIVYAVVERARPAPRARGGELRTLRILHVYKGALSAGQLLTMHLSEGSSMCAPQMPASMRAPRGAYGVLLLYPSMGDELPDFLWPEDVTDLIQAGIIVSARP